MILTLLRLFWEYFKTGLFSVGGGLATLPFIYDMADKTGWFTHAQIADMIAVAESTPGPIGINMASYVGFTTVGVPGAIVATLLGEIGIRLVYEAIMLNVVIARNTSDIKRAMGIADPMDADGISSPAPNMTPPSTTATNCSVCGAPVKPGAAFCGNCGSKLG